jgi:hypothetical protein
MDMDSLHTVAPQRRRGTYLNAVLTANAVLLGLVLVGNAPSGRAPSAPLETAAMAQPPAEEVESGGRVSPADQRKQMISELQNISAKMAALEARLKGPLTVKVLEMPRESAKDPQKPAK